MFTLGDRGSIGNFWKWAPFHFQRKITLDIFLLSFAHHNLRLFADELVNHETTKGKTEEKMTIAGSPPWREEEGLVLWRGEEEKLGDFSLEPILNLVIVVSLVTFLISGDIVCGSLPL